MPCPRRSVGFSLVEVVIALGVVGVAVVSTIGLLPSLTRQTNQASDTMIVHRLPAAIQAELMRAGHGGSLTSLAARIKKIGGSSTLQMVASRDGREVHLVDDTTLAADQQYFLVELWQFSGAPLAFDGASGALLAAYARVSWPYRLPNPSGGPTVETAVADRSEFTFPVAINR